MTASRRHTGSCLIEVTISIAVLAFSALTVTWTLAYLEQASRAAIKTEAGWRLAAELAEWLRLNGNQSRDLLPENAQALLNLQASSTDCFDQPCSSQDAALFYLKHWYRRLSQSLPGSWVAICHDDQATAAQSLHLLWSCNSEQGSASPLWLKLGWPEKKGDSNFPPSVILMIEPVQ